jgi:hypothetical protein
MMWWNLAQKRVIAIFQKNKKKNIFPSICSDGPAKKESIQIFMKRNKNALFSLFSFFTKFKKGVSFQPYSAVVEESIDIEYRVSD